MTGGTTVNVFHDLGINNWQDVGVILGIVVLLYGATRRGAQAATKHIVEAVEASRQTLVERTEPLQPTANGGNSLNDLRRAVDGLARRVVDLQDATSRTERGVYANSRDMADLTGRFDEHIAEAQRVMNQVNSERADQGKDRL